MKNAKYYLVFNRRNTINDKGIAAIDIAISHNKRTKFISTGVAIKEDHWNDKEKVIKYTNRDSVSLNVQINEQLQELKKVEYNCILREVPFTLDMLNKREKEKIQSFTKFFKSEINTRADLRDTTIKSIMVGYKSFANFAGDIGFDELDFNMISNYDNYLRNKNYSDFTVQTRHKILKTYINIAIKKGYIDANKYPYRNFKVKQGKSNRKDLSFKEIECLEQLSLNTEGLRLSKDLFLFSCYTGLRFEDVMHLMSKNIIKTTEGNIELKKIIIKTAEEIRMPLSYLFGAKAIPLIEKYQGNNTHFIFPQKANQSVNQDLKIIAHLISFDYTLSFHIARHTFGSRLAELNPDPYLIMELMGHKDIKTSMIYIKTSGRVLENKLKNMKW